MSESTDRQRLLEKLQQAGIHDKRLLAVLERVPREHFVEPQMQVQAYVNAALPIGFGQTISQPYIVGVMTQALNLQPHKRVLEIGTGSGYQTAILAELAAEVISIERVPELAEQAQRRLANLGYHNALIYVGDGTLGYAPSAPYDAIIVTAGGPHLSQPLLHQLADGGRLVAPVGSSDFQTLELVIRRGNDFDTQNLGQCQFVPLIGAEGWPAK